MTLPTSIELDDVLKERIEHLAEIRRRTPDGIKREAITQYVDREEKREVLRRDTLEAWDEARTTGLHATAEDVERWLSSWGDENEHPVPRVAGRQQIDRSRASSATPIPGSRQNLPTGSET